jgi:DNA-binding PadR family transcriptional regulator
MDGRASRTIYRLTPAGRAALRRYLERMGQLSDSLKETDSQTRNAERGNRN